MSSTFLGVEISRSTLITSRDAMNVTGHNLANSSTEGYSRENINLTDVSGLDFSMKASSLGAGVNMTSISRSRDAFLDGQYRDANSNANFSDTQAAQYSQIEDIINEPSDTGLVKSMQDFETSLKQDLANDPENQAVRIEVRDKAQTLIDRFHDMYSKLTSSQQNIDQQVQAKVQEVNGYIDNIVQLNQQIDKIESNPMNTTPNDLLDQRDQFLDKLSADINIKVMKGTNDQISVYVGSNAIINDQTATNLTTSPNANGFTDVQIGGSSGSITGGAISSMLQMRDTVIPNYLTQLNTTANQLITAINTVHKQGTTLNNTKGVNFFSGTNAQDISLSSDILNDLNNIAASVNGDSGDGTNAINLANAIVQPLASTPNTQSAMQTYNMLVGQLGVDSQQSQISQKNADLLSTQALNQRDSVSGVSLDEETSNLLKFQYQYQAGAKVLSTMDQILQTLIDTKQ